MPDNLKVPNNRAELFRVITDSSQDSIIMMDPQGTISYVNDAACRMFGYTPEEMLGRNLHRLLSPKRYWEAFDAGFEHFRDTGQGVVIGRIIEIEGVRSSGVVFPLELSISSVKIDEGWHSIGIIRDITHRRLIERELIESRDAAENASRTKTEFLTNMSHEIRTPLNAIIGTAQLLMETRLDTEQKKYLKVMETAGKSLLALINDLLDISRIEAGKVTLENIRFNPGEVVGKVAGTLGLRAEEKGIELDCSIDDDVPAVLIGDPSRLQQILVNLVGNAIKFTEEGHVSMHAGVDQRSAEGIIIEFIVSDSGIGIQPGKLEAIFQTFSQADASVTRRFGGTGLGLAICSNLVGMMGGKIGAESTPGEGSTFTFTARFELPDGSEPEEEAPPRKPAPAFRDLNGMRILLVDDSEDNRFLVNAFLRGEDCTVEEAVNGLEALKAAESQKYDVILMDMQMPVMDGYTATKRIREMEGDDEHTPIVALTAHSISTEIQKCLDAGCDVHLAKPVSKSDLLELLSGYVTGRTGDRTVLVRIDPDLSELIPGYISHRREDVAKLRTMLDHGDYEGIQRCGHSMKGSGSGYGFHGLTQIGAFIERAGKGASRVRVMEGIEKLEEYLNNLQMVEDEDFES